MSKNFDECCLKLNTWLQKSRLKRAIVHDFDFAFPNVFKPGYLVDSTKFPSGEIHCYIGYICNENKICDLENDKVIKFIIEHITPILLNYEITNITFGNKEYVQSFGVEYIYKTTHIV